MSNQKSKAFTWRGGLTIAGLALVVVTAVTFLPWSQACGADRPRCAPICLMAAERQAVVREERVGQCERRVLGTARAAVVRLALQAKGAVGMKSHTLGGVMSELVVSDTAGLRTALAGAQGGDTILLAPGRYTPLTINNQTFSEDVIITSQDPANRAVLEGLTVKDSSGVTFRNLEFTTEATTAATPFKVTASSDIHFEGLSVHGSLNMTPWDDTSAFQIRDSRDVSITHSEFQQLMFGISHLDSSDLKFSGNYFHDIRLDGIRGGGSSNVEVSYNYFTDFYLKEGDHSDAIQFWTSNTKTSAHDLSIFSNVVIRGNGVSVQGVFIRDEVGGLPFENVKIHDNLVLGGLGNGIAVLGGQGVEIRGNTVAGFADLSSRIRVDDSENVVVADNGLTLFIDRSNTALSKENNRTINTEVEVGGANLKEWVNEHTAELENFHAGVTPILSQHLDPIDPTSWFEQPVSEPSPDYDLVMFDPEWGMGWGMFMF